jgi:hypothetical protein
MNAIRAPVRQRSSTKESAQRVRRRVCAWLAPALLAMSAQSLAQQQPLAAVWQERNLTFSYASNNVIYSCDALERRVASILRAVGARDDIKVRASNCSMSMTPPDARINTPGNTPPDARINTSENWNTPVTAPNDFLNQHNEHRLPANVRIHLMMPTEVTPEVLAELKKDKSRRELVAHVTGNPAAALNDPVAFLAQRQLVTVSHKSAGVEPEECELLDQMATSLFRELGVTVVSRNYVCDPKRLSQIPPEFVAEALMVAPYGTSNPQENPAAGKKDDGGSAAPAPADDDPAKPAADRSPK